MFGRLPSIIECPYCKKTFRKLSYSRSAKQNISCVHCNRMFHIWEARLYERVSGGVEEVTEDYEPKLLHLHISFTRTKKEALHEKLQTLEEQEKILKKQLKGTGGQIKYEQI